jgi:UDP-N-acetylmuramoyl-L-alanyl-D-glutamate--2,6-diaminopimelate ligase
MRETAAGVVPGKTLIIEADRERAINRALEGAKRGDVILIAGKGHEEYQIDQNGKHHFNDREIVEQFLGRPG